MYIYVTVTCVWSAVIALLRDIRPHEETCTVHLFYPSGVLSRSYYLLVVPNANAILSLFFAIEAKDSRLIFFIEEAAAFIDLLKLYLYNI